MEATAFITSAAFILSGHALWSARWDQTARVRLQASSEQLPAGDVPYSPPWVVERVAVNRYLLRNAGEATEYDIRAMFPDNPHVLEQARVGRERPCPSPS